MSLSTERRGRTLSVAGLAFVLMLAPPFWSPQGMHAAAASTAASAASAASDDAEMAAATKAYFTQLRAASPAGWLEQQFRRQRHFPALARSRMLIAKGEGEQAARELEDYLASDPGDLVIQFHYLILASTLKQYRAAIRAADGILDAIPGFAPARYYRGLARAALGESEKALSDLAAAAASRDLSPADAAYARRSIAEAALSSPKPEQALALLDHENAGHGERLALLIAKGQVLERLGRLREAARIYDEVAKTASDSGERRTAWILGSQLALKRGEKEGALSRAQAAWELAPGNPQAARVLAEAASALGRTALVLKAERDVITAGKMDRATEETFANAMFQLGQDKLAADRFEALARTAASPSEEYRLRRAAGYAAQAAKEPARAFSQLQRAAAINPEPEALSAAAEAAVQAGRLDAAAAELKRLADAEQGRDQARALMRLSVVEEKSGDIGAALAALGRIPQNQRDAGVERRSAFLAIRAGDHQAALRHAQRLAQLEPRPESLRVLAEAQIAAGQPAAAIKPLEEALKLDPQDPSLRETLGHALVAAGQPARATTIFASLAAVAGKPAEEYRLRMAAGFAALKAGEASDALAMFRRAVALDANPTSLTAAAGAARRAGAPKEAVGFFERLAALEPSGKNLGALGQAQLAAGETAAAVKSFEAALAREAGDDPGLHEALANALVAAGQPARAAGIFAALAEKAKSPQEGSRLRLAAGFAALKAGDTAQALAEFRTAVVLQPSQKALAAAAETALKAGQTAAAATYFERLAAAPGATGRAQYLLRLSVVYEQMGRLKEAEEALDRLPKSEQDKPAIIRRQAVLAQKRGDRKLLLSRLRALAAVEPNEKNFAALADAQIAAGDIRAAATTLASLLADHDLPKAARARFTENLANIAAERRQPGRAQALFARAYELSPDHPPKLLAQAAQSAMTARDWGAAARWYRSLVSDRRAGQKARSAYARGLGDALLNLSRNKEALAAYDEAVRLGGAVPALYARRGAVLMRLHRPAQAAAALRTAYDLEPRVDYALSLGYAHQAAGRPGLAIVFLSRALDQPGTMAPAQRRQAEAALGYAYSETGQNAQAARYFERALAAWPNRQTGR